MVIFEFISEASQGLIMASPSLQAWLDKQPAGTPPSITSKQEQKQESPGVKFPVPIPDRRISGGAGVSWITLSRVAARLQRLKVMDDAAVTPAADGSQQAEGGGSCDTWQEEFGHDDENKENAAPPACNTVFMDPPSPGAHTDVDDCDDIESPTPAKRRWKVRVRPLDFWEHEVTAAMTPSATISTLCVAAEPTPGP